MHLQVLSAIYEQDFLPCSFGGRPELSAHKALATLNEIIAGRKVGWVLEADLKNFFGSLDHGWLLRFVEHRVGDPRIHQSDQALAESRRFWKTVKYTRIVKGLRKADRSAYC